jgi:hypothetical protein
MSATLTGPIVAENMQPVGTRRVVVVLDTQIYVSPGQVLTGRFNYFDSTEISSAIGHFFAWLYVRIFLPRARSPSLSDDRGPTNDHWHSGLARDLSASVSPFP